MHDPKMLNNFRYTHLPNDLQIVSKPFHDLAQTIERTVPDNSQRDIALQKLLEAKDAAVRAALYKSQ